MEEEEQQQQQPRMQKRPRHAASVLDAGDATRAEMSLLLQLKQDSMPVFIVEEHSDAVACIYRALRRRLLPVRGVHVVHLDAHPDLSLPKQLSPEEVFQPGLLQQRLHDSETGISEWLLPLVFAGHISAIHWLRPEWSRQLDDGKYSISVGVVNSCLRVDCSSPYWKNEGVHASPTEMADTKSLNLTVGEFGNPNVSAEVAASSTHPTILDICLDYFVTRNPFLDEIREKFAEPEYELIHRIFFAHRVPLDSEPKQHGECKDLRRWDHDDPAWTRQCMHEISLRQCVESMLQSIDCEKDNRSADVRGDILRFCELVRAAGMEASAAASDAQAFAKLLKSCSTAQLQTLRECWVHCDLPEREQEPKTLDHLIRQLEQQLMAARVQPSIVTIACSCDDGFVGRTDMMYLLETLQAMLLRLYPSALWLDVRAHDEILYL